MPNEIHKYRAKISGPLLDRVYTHIEVPAVRAGEASEDIRKRVNAAKAYTRILKVARTIADLDCNEEIESRHVAEAIQYRSLDRGVA